MNQVTSLPKNGYVPVQSPQNVVDVGEKIHIITRRSYKEDVRRHFAGIVTAVSGVVIRIEGYLFVFNPVTLEYVRRPELRTKIVGLGDANQIATLLPRNVVLKRLGYVVREGRLVVTDGTDFSLDIVEFNASC
jgi:hypothetical protein